MEIFVRGARSTSPSDVAVTYITDRCRAFTLSCKSYAGCPVLQIAAALGMHGLRLFRFYIMTSDGVFTSELALRTFNVRVRCGTLMVIIAVEYHHDMYRFIGFEDDTSCLFELTMASSAESVATREHAASYAMCCLVAGTEFADPSRYAGILMPLAAQMIAAQPHTDLAPFLTDVSLRKCGQYIIGAHYTAYCDGAFYADIKAAYPTALARLHETHSQLLPVSAIFRDLFALRADKRLVDVKNISNISTGYLRCGQSKHRFPVLAAGFFDDVYFAMTHSTRQEIVSLLGPVCPIFCYVDSLCVRLRDMDDIAGRIKLSKLSFSTQIFRRIYVVSASEYIVETTDGEYIVKGCSPAAKHAMLDVIRESSMFDRPLSTVPASISSILARYHHLLSHAKSTTTTIFCPFVQATTPRPAFERARACPLCRTAFTV